MTLCIPASLASFVIAGMKLRNEGGANYQAGGGFLKWLFWGALMLTIPGVSSWLVTEGVPGAGQLTMAAERHSRRAPPCCPAALALSRQSPGLLLPTVVSAPPSYTRTQETDKALVLARSLVQLGLGSLELWKRHGANCSLFVREALYEWLASLGATLLRDRVDLDFAIVEELEDNRSEDMAAIATPASALGESGLGTELLQDFLHQAGHAH